MPDFLITPGFDRAINTLSFEAERINNLARAEYNDRFGFYQQMFGLYSYMRMTQDLEYKIHYPQGTPFMWQTHNSCAWTPTGTLSMGSNTIAPCKVKINEEQCYDELFDSVYKSFLTWEGPVVEMNALGVQYTDELLRTIVENATLGARLTLSAGQLHSSIAFEAGASSRIQDAFNRTTNSCKGWIKLVNELSATYPWLEIGDADGGIVSGDISTDGATYTGSVVDLYDAIMAEAPAKLQNAIIEGGVGARSMAYPLFIVSPSMLRALYAEYQTQNATAAMNKPRISQVAMTYNSRTVMVYKIDETIVVPLTEVGEWEQYVTGTSHFAYLTMSGVIQLGASFNSIPNAPAKVGVMVQKSNNLNEYGKYYFLAHALMATAINDVDYIAGDYLYATP